MGARTQFGLIVIAAIVTGCLEPSSVATPTLSPTARETPPPPTPTPAPTGRPNAVAGCPNYVLEPETGTLPPDLGPDDPIFAEHDRIGGDRAVIRAYTADHADEFGSRRIENVPRVRLVVGFTAHLEDHCAALRALLEFPDEFELIWSAHTAAELEAIQADVLALAEGHLNSAADLPESIELMLLADGEAIAAEVAERYGDVVDITVGLMGYPGRTLWPGFNCATWLPELEASPLRSTLVLDAPEVRSGANFLATLTLANPTDAALGWSSGFDQPAYIYIPGSQVPIGGYFGVLSDVGMGGVAAGTSIELRVVGGTASCDPALGYAVPPGDYEVRVPAEFSESADAPRRVHLSEAAPIRIVP